MIKIMGYRKSSWVKQKDKLYYLHFYNLSFLDVLIIIIIITSIFSINGARPFYIIFEKKKIPTLFLS